MEAILLLRPDRAGDALKTLPALRSLVDKRLELEIHLLASQHNASIFALEPGITLHTELPPQKFSKVINLLSDSFDYANALLTRSDADTKLGIGSAHPPAFPNGTSAGRPESLNIALILSQALNVDLVSGLTDFSTAPVLSETDRLEALTLLGEKQGEWLALCPFASRESRSARLGRWRRFISRIEGNTRLFLFGQQADLPAMQILRDGRGELELVTPSSFRALGACLARMDGVVAVESGPLHMARALGIPSLGIFGRADLERWFLPLGERDGVLERGRLSRYPLPWEMSHAFKKWRTALVPGT